jgi:hypothetical protein
VEYTRSAFEGLRRTRQILAMTIRVQLWKAPRRAMIAALCVLGTPAAARAQSDSAAVTAVAQRLLDAINQRDATVARSVLAPGAQFMSTRAGAAPRRQSDSSFVQSLATTNARYLERMWSPVVRVKGAIADVWAPYDFHIDGKFSHCGVDTFTLLKGPSGWQIVSVVYTVEPTGCAPSPLGPPKQ